MKRRVESGVCEVDCFNAASVARAKAGLPPEHELRALSRAFKALGHPNRLRILRALDGNELCVCDLSQVLGLSMSGTSQQLKELRDLGAIDYRTEGKLVFYSVADPLWLELSHVVAKHLGHSQPKRTSKKRSA